MDENYIFSVKTKKWKLFQMTKFCNYLGLKPHKVLLDSTYCLPVNYLYIPMLGACPHSCNTSLDADER